jgi:hypothetical protein
VCPTLSAVETDIGDVVLTAGIRASRNVDAQAANFGQTLGLKCGLDRIGQTAALGDSQVAGVGSRASHDIADQFSRRTRHVECSESIEEERKLLFGEIAQSKVLAIRDADVDSELTDNCGKPVELCGCDIAETGVGDGGHCALCGAANDV